VSAKEKCRAHSECHTTEKPLNDFRETQLLPTNTPKRGPAFLSSTSTCHLKALLSDLSSGELVTF